MNRLKLTGIAFVCATVLASPPAAFSANQERGNPSSSAGASQPTAADADRMEGRGAWRERDGHRMGHGRGDKMRHAAMHRTPQDRCLHRVARRAGMAAYAGTMLNLTAEQRPLWNQLNDVLQQNLQKAQQLCTSLAEKSDQDTPLDRLDRAERFISARLQALQQIRPPLERLYETLTPEQRAVVDRMLKHQGKHS